MKPYKIPISVLVVIHTPDGQVLLLERADRPGFWQSVTGSLDASDEPPHRAAVRELLEETGLQAVDKLPGADSSSAPSVVPGMVEDGPVAGDAPLAGHAADGALVDLGIRNHYEIYAHWRHRYGPGVTHNTEHVFALEVPAPQPVRLAAREHLASAWLGWQAAAERCFSPSNAEAIRLLAQRHGWADQLGSLRSDDGGFCRSD